MIKRLILVLLASGILFGAIFGYGMVRAHFIKQYFATFKPPPITISATPAKSFAWKQSINAIGSLKAIHGVEVNSQQAGQIEKILFQSGQRVQEGDELIILNDRLNQQDLLANQSQLKLTQMIYDRQRKLFQTHAVSQQDLDQARANWEQAQAKVAQTEIIIDQKHIQAPFSGKLGIRQVNIGEYVTPGQALVSLQSLDPLFVNFTLQEQYLPQLNVGQSLSLKVDNFPQEIFEGKVSATNAAVDTQTRNIEVQGVVSNAEGRLYPGLFAQIQLWLPTVNNVVAVPETGVSYTLYGDTVYVLKPTQEQVNHQMVYEAEQRTIKTGQKYEGWVAIIEGIQAGDLVVTSGQLKLHPNARTIINNQVSLTEEKTPTAP